MTTILEGTRAVALSKCCGGCAKRKHQQGELVVHHRDVVREGRIKWETRESVVYSSRLKECVS